MMPPLRRTPLRPILALALLLAAGLTLAACDSGSSTDETASFDRVALLDNYGANVIVPAYEGLDAAAADLDAAAQAFANAPSAATLAGARARLEEAHRAWQDASFFQFGPAASVTLRSALNTYPTDQAKVEANIASGSYALGSLDDQAAGGFPALGYLLYGAPGTSDAEVIAAFTDDPGRGAYLTDNAAFVRSLAGDVLASWSPQGGDYLATFTRPENAGTDVGSSLGMVINAFVRHYERFLRDGKIGIPAGVRSSGVPRPTSVEAVHGGYSAALAVANLRAVERLYLGTGHDGQPGLGLDDYLRARGAEALGDEIAAKSGETLAALQALDDPLHDQITSNNAPVLTAFQEMQDLVVLLKADMTSVLGVTITYQDNDGD